VKADVGVVAFIISALVVSVSSDVRADNAREIEMARVNAKEPGPLSDGDKELLRRWGCYSDSKNEFCKELANGNQTAYSAKRKKKNY
jgi:hypothetical protein